MQPKIATSDSIATEATTDPVHAVNATADSAKPPNPANMTVDMPAQSADEFGATVILGQLDRTGTLSEQVKPGDMLSLGGKEYVTVSVLGSGGQGTVIKARDLSLNRMVALKRANPNKDGSTSEDADHSIVHEAQAIAATRHPNIVHIHSLDKVKKIKDGKENGEDHWFVYEYIEGMSLEERLKAGPPPSASATALIVAKMASALQAVHECGLCHRDVKPANIILEGKNGQPYLTDFGVAMPLSKDKKPEGLALCAGSQSYMSPEQAKAGLRKETDVDERADIFSLGIVMHEMLSGKQVYPIVPGEKRNNLFEKVANTTPVPPLPLVGADGARIPVELARICNKATQKDPEKRYQTAAAMENDLNAYIEKVKNGKSNPNVKRLLAGLGIGLVATTSTFYLATGNRKEKELPPPQPTVKATAEADPKPKPKAQIYKTTLDDLVTLREWELPGGKTINLPELLETQYQKNRNGLPDTIQIFNGSGKLVPVPNTMSNYTELLQNVVVGKGDEDDLKAVLRQYLIPVEQTLRAANNRADDEKKPFGIPLDDLKKRLSELGIEYSPEIIKGIKQGLEEYDSTIQDYRAETQKRLDTLASIGGERKK